MRTKEQIKKEIAEIMNDSSITDAIKNERIACMVFNLTSQAETLIKDNIELQKKVNYFETGVQGIPGPEPAPVPEGQGRYTREDIYRAQDDTRKEIAAGIHQIASAHALFNKHNPIPNTHLVDLLHTIANSID